MTSYLIFAPDVFNPLGGALDIAGVATDLEGALEIADAALDDANGKRRINAHIVEVNAGSALLVAYWNRDRREWVHRGGTDVSHA